MNNKYFNDIKLRINSSLKVEHAINEVISCRNGFDILYMENLGLDDESEDDNAENEDNKKHKNTKLKKKHKAEYRGKTVRMYDKDCGKRYSRLEFHERSC
ncbi:14609_t:CDS:2 [Funneliformis caledonium]|uniref:14609_t:CDS:1 n=1 Tax=Funneliformis caledonium TaxID=1117310 RepID=A0A9N9D7F6_9GLOM|nr:14609_t:CDS:2 [Funneliformis caledonium]